MSVVRVRELLADHRQAGLDFAAAWPAALDALAPEDRQEWLEVLEDTAPAWEAAYRGLPALRAQVALSAISTDPERDVPVLEPDGWQRICGSCGGPIAAEKKAHARFCSRTCQRAIHGRRVAA